MSKKSRDQSEHLVRTGIDLIVNEFIRHAYAESKLREGENGGSTIDEQIGWAARDLRRNLEGAYRDIYGRLNNGSFCQDLTEARDNLFPANWETFGGDYEVVFESDLDPSMIDRLPQLAYVVDPETSEIHVGASHSEIAGMTDGLEGGWIYPRERKVAFKAPDVDPVSDKVSVMYALSNALGMGLGSKQ